MRCLVLFALVAAVFAADKTIQWTEIPNPGDEPWIDYRMNAASVPLVKNGEMAVFIFGGTEKTQVGCCVDAWFYYPNRLSKNRFERAATNKLVNSTGLYLHRMAVARDHIYVHGGTWGDSSVAGHNEVYRYSIINDTWELYDKTGPNLVSHSLTASVDGLNLIVFGGKASTDYMDYQSDRLYIFNILSKNWTMYSPSWGKVWPTRRDSHSAVIYKGKDSHERLAVIGGGYGQGSATCPDDMFWSLDLVTKEWSYLPFPEDIYCFVDGAVLQTMIWNAYPAKNETFVMFGGDSAASGSWNMNAYVYNGYSNKWTTFKTDSGLPNPIGIRMFASGFTTPAPDSSRVYRAHLIAGCKVANAMLPFCEAIDSVWEMKLQL